MRRVDLELLVQGAVERRQAGRPLEDDRIEFKSDWPRPDRARQMAGAANALRGDTLIYVIGADDTGKVQPLSQVDPVDWFRAFAKNFDSTPPHLVMHHNVTVGDGPEDVVVALVFQTDEYPYVMTVPGQDRREVPLRQATGTVSANRFQLMRILAPAVRVPPVSMIAFSAAATYADYDAYSVPGGQRPARSEVHVDISAQILIEYVGTHVVTMPLASFSAELLIGTETYDCGFSVARLSADQAPPRYGVYAEGDTVVATGAGIINGSGYLRWEEIAEMRDVLRDRVEQLGQAEEVELRVRFAFVGAEQATVLSMTATTRESVFDVADWETQNGHHRFRHWSGATKQWSALPTD